MTNKLKGRVRGGIEKRLTSLGFVLGFVAAVAGCTWLVWQFGVWVIGYMAELP